MSQGSKPTEKEEMRDEYDIRGGVRGKYYERYRQGTNVVLLEEDVAAVFRNADLREPGASHAHRPGAQTSG